MLNILSVQLKFHKSRLKKIFFKDVQISKEHHLFTFLLSAILVFGIKNLILHYFQICYFQNIYAYIVVNM